MQGISPNPVPCPSPVLQEHDYIGLSSKPAQFGNHCTVAAGSSDGASDGTTDLRLGLALDLDLGLGLSSNSAPRSSPPSKKTETRPPIAPKPSSPVKRSYDATTAAAEAAPSEDSSVDDPSPPKCQVVGWPPVRCYRRHALASKPAEMFVKVNMDGITVGRKVDLNSYSSYESLQIALEEMFQPSAQGQLQGSSSNDLKHFLRSNGSEFVLTYEDKDGDWMLVGDVPWSMFVSTVKRLRIARGSETNNSSDPRRSEKPRVRS